jgi:predicted dehydrogenase
LSAFATLDDTGRQVRFIQVGAGGMGRAWTRVLEASEDAELVGLVDLDLAVAREAAGLIGRPDLPVARSIAELLAHPLIVQAPADAVLNVTVPVAHHPVTTEALSLGLPVLSEKPIAPTVAVALSLVATAELSGQLLMISQSRRYYRHLESFKRELTELGTPGVLTNAFFKAPHFGGFRETMQFPLLVDMAIHPFDVARYLLDQAPVSVYCESFNPEWSWYEGDAAANALFEFDGGTRFSYSGSWCSPGQETSWNGSWRASTQSGTVSWDGDNAPQLDQDAVADQAAAAVSPAGSSTAGEEIAGSLAEFVSALRTGTEPSGEVHSNVDSLAMVEAAVLSATTRTRVLIDDVLEAAYAEAQAVEARADVRTRLEEWGSARAGLAQRAKFLR